jgi:multiple sugar transport system permease protein
MTTFEEATNERQSLLLRVGLTPKRRRFINSQILNLLTWFFVFLLLFPIGWLVLNSFQTNGNVLAGTPSIHFVTTAYRTVWQRSEFPQWFMHSVIIVGTATIFATAFSSSAGYALARFRFRGADSFSLAITATQLIPGSMFLIPMYMNYMWIYNHLGIQMIDTYKGMIIIYTAFFTPIAIYLMRAFFASIPKELEEAAQVDGCTPFWAFVRIVLPNAAPGILATGVYAFLTAWDELLFAQWLVQQRVETIPVGIRNFIGNYNQQYDQLMAAGVLATFPVLIAFFATQRWLVKGLTAGAVKG